MRVKINKKLVTSFKGNPINLTRVSINKLKLELELRKCFKARKKTNFEIKNFEITRFDMLKKS
jgi:hypothetical protein